MNLDDEKAREVWAGPVFIELVSLLLLDTIVACKFEPFAVIGLQVWIGWSLAKTVEVCGKVPVKDN